MRLGILSQEPLPHPCDLAFGTLLGPSPDKGVLYLVGSNHGLRAIAASLTDVERGRELEANEGLALPCGDRSLQLVVLSLSDCWPSGSRAQRRLLSEIQRVLAASGELLIVTRNRYGHSRLRDMLRRQRLPAAGKQTRLPSKRALERLLATSGFRFAEWFTAFRDRQGCLTGLRPLGSPPPGWHPRRLSTLRARIRNSSWFANEYVVRAAVREPAASALQECLEHAGNEIDRHGALPQGLRIDRLLVTPKEKVVVLSTLNERAVVMRIPLSAAAFESCRRNMAALRALSTRQNLAPSPLAEGFSAGYYYAVESRTPGKPMLAVPAAQADLRLIEGLIRNLNPRPAASTLDGAMYETLVSTPLARVMESLWQPEKREALERKFHEGLRGKRVATGIAHGDLSMRNVFIENGSVSGVIDWDESCLEGCPLLDAISHVCSRQYLRRGTFADTITRLARRQWQYAEELAFLDRCYEHFGIERGAHGAMVYLHWLNATAHQLDLWFGRQGAFVRERIHDVVDAIPAKSFEAVS